MRLSARTIASDRRLASSGGAFTRWNASRCADFGPIPGSRESSSIRSWIGPSYTYAPSSVDGVAPSSADRCASASSSESGSSSIGSVTSTTEFRISHRIFGAVAEQVLERLAQPASRSCTFWDRELAVGREDDLEHLPVERRRPALQERGSTAFCWLRR